MKNIILAILAIIFTTACTAQQPIAKMNVQQVKVSNETYKIQKEGEKFLVIRNSSNKLKGIKPVAPNLPSDVKVNRNMKLDEKLLTQICADVIPLSTLEKMPMGYGDFLFISFKVSPSGKPIEMDFFIINTSLITAAQIQKIEDAIKRSGFKFVFTNGIERFFNGVNYFNIDVPILYQDMLKVKRAH